MSLLHHLHNTEVLLDFQWELPLFHFVSQGPLETTEKNRKSGSVSFAPILQIFINVNEIIPEFLFSSRLNSPKSFCLSSQERCSNLFLIFMALLRSPYLLQYVYVSCVGDHSTGSTGVTSQVLGRGDLPHCLDTAHDTTSLLHSKGTLLAPIQLDVHHTHPGPPMLSC